MGSLSGRAVVVTGAARGLGRAYALHAARAGASVVVNDIDLDAARRVADEIDGAGGLAVASGGSVSDPGTAEELIGLCATRFETVDGLVNNAGIFHQANPWDEDEDRVRALVEVNVLGTIYCGLAAIAWMANEGRAGSIVNVTSGTHLGHPQTAVYGATKGAIASLTYGWALDLQPLGIRVNAISPLAVTDMKLPPYDGHAKPSEVAAVVTFLLGEESTGVTGQVVRRARRGLGLMRHPEIETMVEADSWEVADIGRAFATTLSDLRPIGYGSHRLTPAPNG